MKQDPQAAVNWVLANEDFPIENYGVSAIWAQLDQTYDLPADLPAWRNQAARLVRRLQETNREAYEKSLASVMSEREGLSSHIHAFIEEHGLELEPEDPKPE
ncbi:MAG: hypothetical protein KDN22_18775 [Verrucomicrobiae bacterium]|nr:hypothetical protein [Verrucomicrobiae bacterium]